MTDGHDDEDRWARLARATDALASGADFAARVQAAVQREPARRSTWMAATLCALGAVAALTMVFAERAETSLDTDALAAVAHVEIVP